ncbi:hypothetical protein LO763_24500 [Glycomyces sp. A-F 0318]|uniref:YwqJ-related putative deaminase n=1 Tax=Glycomyces amatae TaxID=2881355 RepID=UPI001E61F97C|nr:YwqJ-related putative deaminase [Glycomyces amatae]MCD0446783.1 hypothetical protein [Glycomyces amatae]
MPKSGPKSGSKAQSTIINKVVNVDGVFRKPEPRGRSEHPDPDVRNLENKLDDIGREPKPRRWDYMEPSGDRNRDHERLKERWNEFIDENPRGWSNKQRTPCVSAVWDRQSGRVYYDHNVHKRDKWNMNPDDLDPILRERYNKSLDKDGPFWKLQEDQGRHGAPGTHSETRATNQALKDARADGREPFMEDFMIHNGNPKSKDSMRCCGNCTQMCDGAHGSKAGWESDGAGSHRVDESWNGDFSV